MFRRPRWLLPIMVVRLSVVAGGALWQLTLYNPLRETIDTTVVPYEVRLRREDSMAAMRPLSTAQMQTYNWLGRLTRLSMATGPLAAVPLGFSILVRRGQRAAERRYLALGLASVEAVVNLRIVCPPPIIASTEARPRVNAGLWSSARPPSKRRTSWAGFSCCC